MLTSRPTLQHTTRAPFAKLIGAVLVSHLMLSVPAAAQEGDAGGAEVTRSAAIKAVQGTLPSVAILGQKAGPANTVEVFIQVPGVLNMQSVYVLGDGKTVISGVIVPPIADGFPGSAITLPDGNATVDPRAPRANASDLNRVLGIGGQPQPSSKPSPDVVTNSSASGSVAVPSPSTAITQKEASDKVASSQPSPAGTAAGAPDADASGAAGSAVPSPAVKGVAKSSPQGADNEDILIESLDDVADTGAFSRLVSHALANDPDVGDLRTLAGKPEQSSAYLEVVRSLPAIVQGNSDRKVYVMFDPNCPVCHAYYDEVALEAKGGQVEIHWIPAIVFPDDRSSLTASAALLAETFNDDGRPLELLDAIMTDDAVTAEIDSAPGVDKLVPYLGMVVKSTAVMAMARAETPLIVFENTKGELAISPGIPKPGYLSLVNREG